MRPEMVKVMELGGGQEGEVVSTVGDGGADQGHAVPHGGGGHVRAQDHRPDDHRQQVGELQQKKSKFLGLRQLGGVSHGPLRTLKVSTHHVLQRMGVGGHHADGGGPLMVLLVETFIEVWLVEQPGRGGGETLMAVRRR